jgi:hypothetical protein
LPDSVTHLLLFFRRQRLDLFQDGLSLRAHAVKTSSNASTRQAADGRRNERTVSPEHPLEPGFGIRRALG